MIKPCKLCSKDRYANTSFCYSHFREREKIKKEEKAKKKLEKKLNSVTFQKSLFKQLSKIAWKLTSEWVRRKDANPDGYVECYTCDCVKHYKEMDCGHFKHGKLDNDLRNLKVQCSKCNRYLHGNLLVYYDRLVDEYGLEWVKKLILDANQFTGYSIEQLKETIKDLREKISNLK